jgi:hypothetical protein
MRLNGRISGWPRGSRSVPQAPRLGATNASVAFGLRAEVLLAGPARRATLLPFPDQNERTCRSPKAVLSSGLRDWAPAAVPGRCEGAGWARSARARGGRVQRPGASAATRVGSHVDLILAGRTNGLVRTTRELPMTLSVLMYAMMLVSLVVLVGVLVVDAARGVLRWSVRGAPRSIGRAGERSATSGTRNRDVVPTRS